jgi:hypothetical protein
LEYAREARESLQVGALGSERQEAGTANSDDSHDLEKKKSQSPQAAH